MVKFMYLVVKVSDKMYIYDTDTYSWKRGADVPEKLVQFAYTMTEDQIKLYYWVVHRIMVMMLHLIMIVSIFINLVVKNGLNH